MDPIDFTKASEPVMDSESRKTGDNNLPSPSKHSSRDRKDSKVQPRIFFPTLESEFHMPSSTGKSFRTQQEPIHQVPKSLLSKEVPVDPKDLLVNKFIGEFSTDKHFKIIRAFVNQDDSDRIFYTKFEPTEFNKKVNILIIHGYGHSGPFLEVLLSAGNCPSKLQLHSALIRLKWLWFFRWEKVQCRRVSNLCQFPGHAEQSEQGASVI